MDSREEELNELKIYTEGIENELSMILQSLQWDRKHLVEGSVLVQCRHDPNHRVPPDKLTEHEEECFLKLNGYNRDDKLLPDPPDTQLGTLIKLSKDDIAQIINNAAQADPMFKRVYRKTVQGFGQLSPISIMRGGELEPLTVEHLQSTYTADERRAIHDAVVSAVPSCHDLTDLAPLSVDGEKETSRVVSRTEILAELRNMRRRRTKYRVAAKTRNYSDVLRDVINTQMEHYNDTQNAVKNTPSERGQETNLGIDDQTGSNNDNNVPRHSGDKYKDDDRRINERRETDRRRESRNTDHRGMKLDRDDTSHRYGSHSDRRSDNRGYNKDRHSDIPRHEDIHRERYGRDKDRDRNRERGYNDNVERDPKYNYQYRRSRNDDDYERRAIKQEPRDDEYESTSNREYDPEGGYRKRSKQHDYIKQEPVDRNYEEDSNRVYYDEGSSRKRHRHHDNVDEVFNNDKNKHHKKKSKKEHRSEDEDGHRHKKHKHKSSKHHHDKDRSRDDRYSERSSERAHIKQEKEDW